jgi:hypothetical protein
MNRYFDLGAKACKGFVDAVIDHLEDKVVKSFGPGRPDIHGRPFTNGFDTTQYPNRTGIVIRFCLLNHVLTSPVLACSKMAH